MSPPFTEGGVGGMLISPKGRPEGKRPQVMERSEPMSPPFTEGGAGGMLIS